MPGNEAPPPPVPPGRLPRRLAAAALGLLLGFALAEALLRVTGFGVYAKREMAYAFRFEPPKGYWEFDPAHTPSHQWDGDPYGRLPPGARMTYAINEAGLRGPLPAAGRETVLVVGDSFTFGEGVGEEETFCARLGRGLGARAAVVNAGVPGYGTEEEGRRLPSLLERFTPKAVVVVFLPNDAIPSQETFAAPDLINRKGNESDPPLRLLALAESVWGRGERDRAVESWYLSFYRGERRDCWAGARKTLEEMRKAAAARGARFGVAHFPLLHRMKDDPLAPIREELEGACREMGVPFCDLRPALAAEGERALWVHPTDHHPDARAHELAAQALLPFVEGLLR